MTIAFFWIHSWHTYYERVYRKILTNQSRCAYVISAREMYTFFEVLNSIFIMILNNITFHCNLSWVPTTTTTTTLERHKGMYKKEFSCCLRKVSSYTYTVHGKMKKNASHLTSLMWIARAKVINFLQMELY